MIADPAADAERHCAELDAVNNEHIKREHGLARDFLSACRKCDVSAIAKFVKRRKMIDHYVCSGLDDVMIESLGYNAPDAPRMSEAMQLLLDVAFGEDPAEKHQAHARALIERMASSFARLSIQG